MSYSREYYLRNKDKTRAGRIARARKWALDNPEKAKFYAKRTVLRKREVMVRAKSKPCMDCGVQYPSWVMEFDHRNPADKKFQVSRVEGCSMANLLLEIAKCDVVCANCHAERTHRQCIGGFIHPYKKESK